MHLKWLPGLSLVLLAGCGPSGPGPYHLSGKVTFNGKPVPAGRIFFLPNAARGQSGQGGFAEIKNGLYDTREKGAATAGGALIVRIDGFDGQTTATNHVGRPLFLNYEVVVDLGEGHGSLDFDVPASAAKDLPKGGDNPP